MTTLLEVQGLVKHYSGADYGLGQANKAIVRAVDGVSFQLARGETLGLVGESGCGKSTLARTLLRLESATSGSARYQGDEIFELQADRLKRFRRQVQIVFQDPYAALNPRMTCAQIIAEPWDYHHSVVAKPDRRKRICQLLDQVGLPADSAARYPHEFSGGQRQRIGIARALALQPELIVLDEPVSALDMSVQAQVINLLNELRESLGLSYLFIAHDLAVVRYLCQRVAVMYLGQILEIGPCERLFAAPRHPYTAALLAASPVPDPLIQSQRPRRRLHGEPPDPTTRPNGCRFSARCWKADALCQAKAPAFVADNERVFACHHPIV